MEGQETYLKRASLGQVVLRGVKKLAVEITSVKFLLLVFVCLGIWRKFIGAETGLGMALLLVGLKEVPVEGVINKLVGKI